MYIMDDSCQFFVMCDSGTYDCHTSTTQPVIMTTSSTLSPSPTSTQVPTQTPPPMTTTTPTTTQQDTDPTTPQQEPEPTPPKGTDPVQGRDQSTPTTIEPSTTDPVSVGPPDTSGNPVNAGLAGGLAVLGLVMGVTLTMVIALLVVRRKSHSNADLHDNIDLHGTIQKQRFLPLLILPVPLMVRERPLHTSLPPHMWERMILQHQRMNAILPHASHHPHIHVCTSNKTCSSHRTRPTSHLQAFQ